MTEQHCIVIYTKNRHIRRGLLRTTTHFHLTTQTVHLSTYVSFMLIELLEMFSFHSPGQHYFSRRIHKAHVGQTNLLQTVERCCQQRPDHHIRVTRNDKCSTLAHITVVHADHVEIVAPTLAAQLTKQDVYSFFELIYFRFKIQVDVVIILDTTSNVI